MTQQGPVLIFRGGPLDGRRLAKVPASGRWSTYTADDGAPLHDDVGAARLARIADPTPTAGRPSPSYDFYVKGVPVREDTDSDRDGRFLGWRYDHVSVIFAEGPRRAGAS